MESAECLSDHRNGQLREGIKSRVLTATCICKREQISRQHHHHMSLFFSLISRRASSTTSLKKVPKVKPQVSSAPQPTWRSLISCQVLSHVNDSFSCHDHFAPSIILLLVFSFYSMET
ncbi:hypothetical protein Peur_049665 [Populus x canadensis]